MINFARSSEELVGVRAGSGARQRRNRQAGIGRFEAEKTGGVHAASFGTEKERG